MRPYTAPGDRSVAPEGLFYFAAIDSAFMPGIDGVLAQSLPAMPKFVNARYTD